MSSSTSTTTTTNNNKDTSNDKTVVSAEKDTTTTSDKTAKSDNTSKSDKTAKSDKTTTSDTTTTTTTTTISSPDLNVYARDLQKILKDYIVIIVVAFLGIFVLIRIFGEDSIFGRMSSLMIDIFVVAILFAWVGYDFLFTYSGDERTSKLKELWNSIKNYINDKYSILYTSLFIFVFYTVVYVLGIPMTSGNQSFFVGILNTGAWTMLGASVLVWILKIFFGISLFEDSKKETTVAETTTTTTTEKKAVAPATTANEVFNIGVNKYTYEDAQSICKSYDARLATYDEIEAAYNNGAEWCNYGWSEGQMAYFPTQKATWTELQKDPARKNDCGRPGVNGGYMVNPYLRFGVNCYGKKPEPRPSELAKMNVRKETVVPKTKEDVELEMKVQFWKENADKLLSINSFNANKWSQYK